MKSIAQKRRRRFCSDSSCSWLVLFCVTLSALLSSAVVDGFLHQQPSTIPFTNKSTVSRRIKADKAFPEHPAGPLQATVDAKANKPYQPAILEPSIAKGMSPQMNTTEMIGMSAAGLAFSAVVVYTLAMETRGLSIQSLERVADNILDAALPLTATDVVSVAVGEGFAGIIGALASLGLSAVLRRQAVGAPISTTEAVADGDFFLAQAGALPLFEALGLPPFLATVASVFVAAVPSELVRIGSKRRQQIQKENELMEKLLVKQRKLEKRAKQTFDFNEINLFGFKKKEPEPVVAIDPSTLRPVREKEDTLAVELFVDIVKWLEYSILIKDFGGRVMWDGVPLQLYPGAEGALFGSLAAISSQFYADILYAYFGWGGRKKQEQVRSRTSSEWAAIYLTRLIYAGTLFGVYEVAQIPAKGLISAVLSGGAEGCYGSEDYNMCIETYLAGNPPPRASLEAELRALATSLYSVWSRLTPS